MRCGLIGLLVAAGMVAASGANTLASAQEPAAGSKALQATISVDAAAVGTPISKYVYGQFIEHLGRCIYGGIWAEMLEDRKFLLRRRQPVALEGPRRRRCRSNGPRKRLCRPA